MDELVEEIEVLKNEPVSKKIRKRMTEFEKKGRSSNQEVFKELCFCIMTANFNAEKAIQIQKEIDNGFIELPQEKLADRLKDLGYRYPNKRSEYMTEARDYSNCIKDKLADKNEKESREWVVKNIKGLGWKESSHFLRNIGYKHLAIIDFHIADLLEDYCLIEKPKYLRKKNYLEIEKVLEEIAEKSDLTLAELDLYLWFMETGKVLK